MTIIMCMVENVITQITHPQQVGCIKGRKMIRHIWGAKGGYDNMSSGIMISFDYSNAFPSLTHPFIKAALTLINLPEFIINVIMATLVSPYHFCIGRGVKRTESFHPGPGIGQGDPFSPLLFSSCASLVPWRLKTVAGLQPYMYVDDLAGLIPGKMVATALPALMEALKEFSLVSGLRLNLAKCGIVIKGDLPLDASSYSQLPISLWSLPSTWSTAWGTSAFLKKAASLAPTNTRQEPQVWASFWTSKFPPSILSPHQRTVEKSQGW